MDKHRTNAKTLQQPGSRRRRIGATLAALVLAGPASAQGLGGLGRGIATPLPSSLGDLPARDLPARGLADVGGLTDEAGLADLRLTRLNALVRAHPKVLDADDAGAPVVRGEVLALSPSAGSLEIARRAGFVVARRTILEGLDLEEVVLQAPPGLSTRAAARRLRALDPAGRYDFDHLYATAGETGTAAGAAAGGAPGRAETATAGLIDTGVKRDHPALAASRIEQRGFAPGGIRAAAHGTAVASLMAGQAGRFRGAAPGARLFAADVYGDGPTGGSIDAILAALAWMARNRAPVINISLVGPPNLALEAAVRALIDHGALIVAPVGNDGPAAPPVYPASYPGVIAVTAVDARRRPLLEAGRASHLDFAAPGAGIAAASPAGGFVAVRGTSFASPIVAGELALLLPTPDRSRAAAAVRTLAARADRRAAGGVGLGLVGEDLASDLQAFPASVEHSEK